MYWWKLELRIWLWHIRK